MLVHGEANEMSRLKVSNLEIIRPKKSFSSFQAALLREYEAEPSHKIQVHNPRNTVAVELNIRGEKMAKVRLNKYDKIQ